MDKDVVVDKIFGFLREFSEFSELTDMRYDSKNGFVRATVGNVEKVIPVRADSWLTMASDVLAWFRG